MNSTLLVHAGLLASLICAGLIGCDKKPEPAPGGPGNQGAGASTGEGQSGPNDDHDHADADHDHGDEAAPGHHHGVTVQLGEQTAGGYTVRASRDGEVAPGGDVPIDVWVTGGETKVAAVRFWIGVEDASGSVKARAEIEGEPTHWHTHAEAPTPMAEGSRLWVEIEREGGDKVVTGFDLKQ